VKKAIVFGVALVVMALSAPSASAQTTGTAKLYDLDGNLVGTVTDPSATFARTGPFVYVSGTLTNTEGNVSQFTSILLDTAGGCEEGVLVLGQFPGVPSSELRLTGVDDNLLCKFPLGNVASQSTENFLNRVFATI
jgi:hypothetical protein